MTYRRYAAERLGASIAVLFLAASLTYVTFHVVGPGSTEPRIDPTTVQGPAQLARYHRYENESYGDFLWQLVGHGSLGRDIYGGEDLTQETFAQAPPTLSLVAGAIVFALLVGISLGLLWARFRRVGKATAAPLSNLALATLPLWAALWLSFYFGYKTSLLPIAGYCSLFSSAPGSCGGPVQWAYHLILPSIALGLALAAVYAGVTRRLMLHVARVRADVSDDSPNSARTARRRAAVAFGKLVVRNASWLIGATYFIELAFQLPGLGQGLLASFYGRPSEGEAILLVATIVAVGLSLAADLVVGAFVPDWRVNEF